MITISQFRAFCKSHSAEEIVEKIILSNDALHVSSENMLYILDKLAIKFGVANTSIYLRVVGSAKLGFSITEKKIKGGEILPRYRRFSPNSDIDTAIVSPEIYRLIWDDIGIFAHGQPYIPWDSGKLGDYMAYGWLRPDHFPKGKRIRRCDDWSDLFRELSSNPKFDRRKVSGALFHSINDLKRYHHRSVEDCIRVEKDPL